jgi:fimbrial chaperone protein
MSMTRYHRLASIVILVAALFQPAQAVTLMPLTLMLAPNRPIASLHVHNDDTRPRIYEIQIFHWTQDDGRDVLTPAPDLVVTPPIMRLEPGEERIVRIGALKTTASPGAEQAFRLLLRDITPVDGGPTQGLHLRLQYLLPVFLSPEKPNTQVSLAQVAPVDGAGCLSITNGGNVHTEMVRVGAAGDMSGGAPVKQYVLAGETTRVCSEYIPAATLPGHVNAGFTSAYQNDMTVYDVPPAHP